MRTGLKKPGALLSVLVLTAGAAILGMSTQTASAAGNTFSNVGVLAPSDSSFTTSTITVSGQPTTLTDVNVALNLYFTNECFSDTQVLLQGPTGIRVPLASDDGSCDGVSLVSGLAIGFDDAAPSSLPASDWFSGIFKPNNTIVTGGFGTDEGILGFPVANAIGLSAFNGTNPNGTWTLFFGDDAGGDSVGVTGGWSLNLNPEAAICSGAAATIVGTAGNDVIVGTSGPDVINAGAGDDIVRGLGGNDLLCGDAGRDKLKGGAGKDRCDGGPGKDKGKCERARQF